jgi:DNA-binding response OmpR family regulator
MQRQHILLTDHSHEVGMLVAEILTTEGYCVRFAAPSECSAMHIREARPDLALIELMPNAPHPTLALLEQLRAHPATATLPVLVTSTDYSLLKSLATTLSNLGCMTLRKPFALDTLLEVVDSALGRVAVVGA